MSGSTSVRDYVSYVPTGETRTRSGALQMGVVTACEGGAAKRVVIAATGRPRVVRQATC
jgi:Tfp pilus assembly protein FimT